jgi:hypothetical protein
MHQNVETFDNRKIWEKWGETHKFEDGGEWKLEFRLICSTYTKNFRIYGSKPRFADQFLESKHDP